MILKVTFCLKALERVRKHLRDPREWARLPSMCKDSRRVRLFKAKVTSRQDVM